AGHRDDAVVVAAVLGPVLFQDLLQQLAAVLPIDCRLLPGYAAAATQPVVLEGHEHRDLRVQAPLAVPHPRRAIGRWLRLGHGCSMGMRTFTPALDRWALAVL